METKRNYYWLWAAIGLLLCLNLITIGWVARRTNTLRAARQLSENRLIQQLSLTPDQTKQYRQSRRQLRLQSKPHEDSLRALRTTLLAAVQRPTVSDDELDQLSVQMARQNRLITRYRFRHWQQVRSLCTPEQQTRFDQLISRIGQGMNNPVLRAQLRNRVQDSPR